MNKNKLIYILSFVVSSLLIIMSFQNCGSSVGSNKTSTSGGTGVVVTPPPVTCDYTTNPVPVVSSTSVANVDFNVGMGLIAGTEATKSITATFSTGDSYSGLVDVNCRVPNNSGLTVNCNVPNGLPTSGTFNISINAANTAECLSGPVTVEVTVDDAIFATTVAGKTPIAACDNLSKTSAVRTFTITRINKCLPTQRVDPTDVFEAGQMGSSVAIDGDWAVTVAPGDGIGAMADAGAAYVMKRTGTSWAITQKLIPSTLVGGHLLSTAAISGSTLVLGAPLAGGGVGRIWIYHYNGSTWGGEKELNPPAGGGGLFGAALAVSGSVVAVGTPWANVGSRGTYSGAAYLYSSTDGAFVGTLTPTGTTARGEFGTSLALSGSTLVVGAPFPNSATTREEAVYIYSGSTLQQKLLNPSTTANAVDRFGYSVSVDGNNLLIGAPNNTNNRGIAYLFKRTSTTELFPVTPSLSYVLSDANKSDKDWFGYSVALKGTRVLVSAPAKVETSPNFGAVYLFNTTDATQLFKIRSRIADRNDDSFGISIGVSAGGWLMSGAYNDESGFDVSNSGSVYFVQLP